MLQKQFVIIDELKYPLLTLSELKFSHKTWSSIAKELFSCGLP